MIVVQEYKTVFKKEAEGGGVKVQRHAGPSSGRKILYLSSNQYFNTNNRSDDLCVM